MLRENQILYHGSYCEVKRPDLCKCAAYKDFGRGFYLTTSFEQAKNFARLSSRKALQNKIIDHAQGNGIVSTFKIENVDMLKIHSFRDADAEWLHCVVAHRKNRFFKELIKEYEIYDVIAGKIANDNTNATIVAYMSQAFGTVGTEQADNICISLLLPERLQDQFCFRSEKSLSSLKFAKCITL